MSYTVRSYSSGDYSSYNRRVGTATISLGFSPGEVRLAPR
jgi:hypothetical protein